MERTLLMVAINRLTNLYSGATQQTMKIKTKAFKISVITPKTVFFFSSSDVRLELEEPDEESTRRTSFIIKPQMQVKSSTASDLRLVSIEQ